MKKILLLATSALLLLAGCAKEVSVPNGEGGLQEVTFTANMAGDVTKAAVDGDGAAANVNRCIMEIYYGDGLFTRMYSIVSDKKASFTTQLVANRTYTVAFWADHVTAAASTPTTDELAQDLYYTTKTDTDNKGLQAIALKGTYVGNIDARDAFFHSSEYTISQAGSAFNATLYRPFAQVNVITTDWDKVSSIESLKPDKVDVTIQNPLTKFNAVTGEASADASVTSLNYNADLYTAPAPVEPVSTTEKTLSMDYLFASTDKAVIDIAWKAQKTDNTDVSHSFSNIPYQRNYRTNIKGNLLTTTGQWNVTVDPIWETPSHEVAFKVVNDIANANDFVASNTDKKEISVTFSSQPADAGTPTEAGKNAIVTSLLAENATYNIDVASSNEVLYVGDYDYTTSGGTTTYNYNTILPSTSEKTNSASVNLVVTNTQYIGTLVVNSPSKSVSINGQTLASDKAYHIENLTVEEVSMNTVIIESGMTVTNMIMKKGGLEIHGSVTNVSIPEGHGTIKVRACEGLSETVYNTLKPYIDVENGYFGEQESGKSTYCIRREVVAKIGENNYYTIAQAFAAVQEGQTITLTQDCETGARFTDQAPLALTRADVTLDLNEHKLTTTINMSTFIAGNNDVIKNGKIYAGANAGKTCGYNSYAINVATETYGTKVTGVKFQNVEFKGGVNMGGAREGDVAEILYQGGGQATFEDCTVTSGDFYIICSQVKNSRSSATVLSGAYNLNSNNHPFCVYDGCAILLKGGTYNADPTKWVAEGYEAVQNGSTWTVQPKATKVAKIGTTEYCSIADAFAAVEDGETIILTNDCSTGSEYNINFALALSKDNVIVDLNNKSLTVNNNFSFILAGDNITLKNGNLVAGSATGKVSGIISYTVTVAAEGTGTFAEGVTLDGLNVTGGIRFGGDETVHYKGGVTGGIVKNCTVGSGDFYCIWAEQNSTATVKSGTFTNKKIYGCAISANTGSTITLEGGTYNDNTNLEAYKAEGCEVVNNGDGTYTVKVIPVFSVSATKKVKFSSGNLYWDGNAYHFEANQWDYTSAYSASHNDHFFYSKTASVAYASTYSDNGRAGDDLLWCAESTPITVEGTEGWYALTYSEVKYILNTRTINGNSGEGYSSKRSTLTLSDNSTVYGVIIVPDNYSGTPALSATTSWADWQTMEDAGCVFLPAAGYGKQSSGGTGYDAHGRYWYGDPHPSGNSYYGFNLDFSENNYSTYGNQARSQALSVRLVHN